MQVEVNEENIVRFSLVQLTGNSKEALLEAAARAVEEGYVLTCRIPDATDDVLQMNIFEAADGEVVSDEKLQAFYDTPNPITHKEEGIEVKEYPTGRVIRVLHDGPVEEVVQGEVIESHIEED